MAAVEVRVAAPRAAKLSALTYIVVLRVYCFMSASCCKSTKGRGRTVKEGNFAEARTNRVGRNQGSIEETEPRLVVALVVEAPMHLQVVVNCLRPRLIVAREDGCLEVLDVPDVRDRALIARPAATSTVSTRTIAKEVETHVELNLLSSSSSSTYRWLRSSTT